MFPVEFSNNIKTHELNQKPGTGYGAKKSHASLNHLTVFLLMVPFPLLFSHVTN